MAEIEQTNRTILFEKISQSETNPLRMDFLIDSNFDNSFKKIKESLMVHSFEEFMETFKPKFYQKMVISEGQDIPKFIYSLEPNGGREFELVNHPFYKAMLELYENKGRSGVSNLEFNYNEILELIYSPEKSKKDFMKIREKLFFNAQEYFKIQARGGSKNEQKTYKNEIINLLTRVKDYCSYDPLQFVPLFIEDVREQLKNEITCDNKSLIDASGKCQPVFMAYDKDGIPKFIPQKTDLNIDTASQPSLTYTSSVNCSDKLIEWIGADFERTKRDGTNHLVIQGNEEHNDFIKKMFLRIFAGKKIDYSNVKREQLEDSLQKYEKIYKTSHESFAKALVRLVEKILNVKAFFDHAGGKAELIVSNCSIEDLFENKYFEEFIEQVGNQNTKEKIWFALIPSVNHNKFVVIESDDDDDDGMDNYGMDNYGNENESSVSNNNNYLVSFTSLKRMLDLLGKCSIITFFNFKGCDRTSFSDLSSDLIKAYKEELNQINQNVSNFSVFCYPNFTLLPERFGSVDIGNKEIREKGKFIQLPPVYIDASYVACGLYVKSQKNDELRKVGFKVNDSLACPVRFDFEGYFKINNNEISLSQIFNTKINKENVLSWSKDVKDEINKDGGFGFCFCGDRIIYRSKTNKDIEQQNVYVYKARTLGLDDITDGDGNKIGKNYRPIYKTLISNYLTKLNDTYSGVYQLENKCTDWTSINNKENINNLLRENDSIEVKKDSNSKKNQITIKYGNDNNYKEVEILEM